jgi:chemotaxis protein MotA
MIFGPIASNLRARDEEEVLCKQIIVEGIMSIQSGENPKFLRERLVTYLSQKQREAGGGGGEGGDDGGKKKKK